MGNVTQCMARRALVRVMRPDGNIMEYEYRIKVALLMALFPGYLVVHSPADRVLPGKRSQIRVMEVNERLRLGQSYVIYPIPSQYKDAFIAPPDPMDLAIDGMSGTRYLNTRLSLKCFSKRSKVERTTKRVKLLARSFLSLFVGRSSTHVHSGELKSDREWMPLLGLDGPNPSSSDIQRERTGFTVSDHSRVWKPDLDDIPEYPRGFHALPQEYEEVEGKSRPSLDRLQPPNKDEDFGPLIGKMTAAMCPQDLTTLILMIEG